MPDSDRVKGDDIRQEVRPIDLAAALKLIADARKLTSAERAWEMAEWVLSGYEHPDHGSASVRVFLAAIAATKKEAADEQ